MKQQLSPPSSSAPGTRLVAPLLPTLPPPQAQRLYVAPGQGQLVWLDAGCELRSLSGTAVLHSPAPAHPGAAPPARLPPHAAWRSPQGAWVGIEAEGAPAVLQATAPAAKDMPDSHEKSRPGHQALQRLWDSVKRLLVRPAQPAG